MSSDKKPIFPPPIKFGQPEKPHWVVWILFVAFVVVSIAGIIMMIVTDPRDKRLVCRSDVPTSLTSFGNCTEE
jgi:hypothetical protein